MLPDLQTEILKSSCPCFFQEKKKDERKKKAYKILLAFSFSLSYEKAIRQRRLIRSLADPESRRVDLTLLAALTCALDEQGCG
jgi:hypothetical protein